MKLDLDTIADAIDLARFAHPMHPRERPRTFAEADEGDQEYARRLARFVVDAIKNLPNATFHAFRRSGKWYTTGRGRLTDDVFRVFETEERRARILSDNGGCYPGLSGPGKDFIFVVVNDEDDGLVMGHPLMLRPAAE